LRKEYKPAVWKIYGENWKMKVKINFRGKDLFIEDIQKVSSVGKYAGLMFKAPGN